MKKYITVALLAFTAGCSSKTELSEADVKQYETELTAWHSKRVEDLKAPNGWINLVGLFWLEPGINSFGSDEKNKIVFPKGIPAKAGYFLVNDDVVSIFSEKGVTILSNGKPLNDPVIFNPDSARSAPLLEFGSLRWNIIKRDDKVGVRLRDLANPEIENFKGVERFPVDANLRFIARFEKADTTKTINITNVLGQTTPQHSPGTLVFDFEGEELRLDALKGGKDELFIIFADATSGRQTYGGGRFLYVKLPDSNGTTTLDFNKAYNPPCVFTPYATCPLPPAQNVLKVAITAGEKNYGHSSHEKS